MRCNRLCFDATSQRSLRWNGCQQRNSAHAAGARWSMRAPHRAQLFECWNYFPVCANWRGAAPVANDARPRTYRTRGGVSESNWSSWLRNRQTCNKWQIDSASAASCLFSRHDSCWLTASYHCRAQMTVAAYFSNDFRNQNELLNHISSWNITSFAPNSQ